MLKQSSKRRRTKQELLLEAAEEEVQSQAQEEAKQRIEELEAQLRRAQAEIEKEQVASQILSHMIDAGDASVAEDGSVSVNKSESPNVIGTINHRGDLNMN